MVFVLCRVAGNLAGHVSLEFHPAVYRTLELAQQAAQTWADAAERIGWEEGTIRWAGRQGFALEAGIEDRGEAIGAAGCRAWVSDSRHYDRQLKCRRSYVVLELSNAE